VVLLEYGNRQKWWALQKGWGSTKMLGKQRGLRF